MSKQTDFINQLKNHAQILGKQYDLFPSVMIAQAIHESGWGQSGLSLPPNFNMFGIKGSYNGKSVTMKTWEDDGKGNPYWINAQFRKYPSYYESMEDNAKLLSGGLDWDKNFYRGAWRSVAKTYQNATSWLQGRYATDTKYAQKLNDIIKGYNLTQYDNATSIKPIKETTGGSVKMMGTFTCNDTIRVWNQPKTMTTQIATYKKGEPVKFDKVHFVNGYVWLEYPRKVGGKGYLPIAPLTEIWGKF